MKHLLIANRGEIAIRIARAANELGIATTAIHAEDDALSLHTRAADHDVALHGNGAPAYLDGEQIVRIARETGCDAIHPGYGFLAERGEFARRCAKAGLKFVGPRPELLDLFGDKAAARAFARDHGVPLLPGTGGDTSLGDARDFFASLGPGAAMMIKAVAGGGGRGMRTVRAADDIAAAYERCRSEARRAFGHDAVYVEKLIERARHIEVQIVGDGTAVAHLGERDCTVQRRHQKIVEIAPSPTLSGDLRARIIAAATRLAEEAAYDNLGTFEFLTDDEAGSFAFIEANPRLQVEHTITEAVTGIDLVKAQIEIAAGKTLGQLGLTQAEIPAPRGYAIELRVNLETATSDGGTKPTSGTLAVFEPPTGPGVRVDTFGYAGYTTVPGFDPLLAKVIVHGGGSFAETVRRAERALAEFRIEGIATNVPFLQSLLQQPEFIRNEMTTRFVELQGDALAAAGAEQPKRYFDTMGSRAAGPAASRAGPPGTIAMVAPMQGTVLAIDVAEGAPIRPGQPVALMDAMKMEHVITADRGGYVRAIPVAPGDAVMEGQPLLFIEPASLNARDMDKVTETDLDTIRPDLAAAQHRLALTRDENRSAAVAKRHKPGKRTARENIAQLIDSDSFVEYGALIVAAQRSRRSLDDLIENTPGDGLVTGIATVNAGLFGAERARCMIMAYDYTVLAGTQGRMNHKKMDRMLALCEQWNLPIILFGEGGGGRPGDTDVHSSGLELTTFQQWARMSGRVPLIAIASGRCYAGNASLVGCCDVIIATRDTNLGMGGPAMIEGGGLGVYRPEEIGPIEVQTRNGVVDVAVEDEPAAIVVARKYLAYFQGAIAEWDCVDQRRLRALIPENRLRAYDIRAVIDAVADTGSVLELRHDFGVGIVTALIRIEGKPFGLFANNPHHLGGAIDADAADKAARFMELCNAFDIPLISLCDTPGFMVGPEIEKMAQVRRTSQMFIVGANVTVPLFAVILRKAYGLGAMAMTGGGFHMPVFTIAWPTGEQGPMGLEGAVRLAYRKEMAAIADPAERKAWYEREVAAYYEQGKALNAASHFQIDAVIDPAETRRWLIRCLQSMPQRPPRDGKKMPFISVW